MIVLDKKQKILVVVCLVIVLSSIGFYIWKTSNNTSYLDLDVNDTIMKNEPSTSVLEEDSFIIIHITGSIQKPGIVKIKEGSRISDAIEAAGRFITRGRFI